MKNITVRNLSSNYQLEFNADTVTVNLLGFEEDFSDINPNDITGTIDASPFNLGVMAAQVSIDGGYTVSETPYTSVTVTEKPDNTGNTDSTDNTGGTDSSTQ